LYANWRDTASHADSRGHRDPLLSSPAMPRRARPVGATSLVLCGLALGCHGGQAAADSRGDAGTEPSPSGSVRVLPVDSDMPVEPSGLAFFQGELLSVSDEEDRTVFRVEIGRAAASMEPAFHFDPPPDGPSDLDLEGIAVCADHIYLVSETADELLEVKPTGESHWVPAGVRRYAVGRGLLGTPGAGLEGVTCAEDGGLVLAAEREPRALLWMSLDPPGMTAAEILDLDDTLVGHSTFSDFSDLASEPGRLWALYRYRYQILEVIGEPGSVTLEPVVDFGDRALDPRTRYVSTRFGMAEGLAADDGYFYVIDDNNDLPRAADPSDSRPILFVIPRR
jgi:hypothetical protein